MVIQMVSRCGVVLVALLAWLGSSVAGAETRGIVLVSGDAAEQYGGRVGQVVEAAVRGAGWSLLQEPLVKIESDRMLACLRSSAAPSCVLEALQIARVFVVKIENGQASDGAPLLILTGKSVVIRPASMAIRQQYCERCSDDRLMAAAAELAKVVLQDLALRAGTTGVEFESVPDGAEIILDGERIGATRSTFRTYPGKHLVRIEKPGSFPEAREVVAEEGKTTRVSVALRPSGADRPPNRRGGSQLVSDALIGGGGALAVTGAIWLHYNTRYGPEGKDRYRHATTLAGGALVVGLGAAGLGAYSLWWGSRSQAMIFGVTSGGGTLGWRGTLR
jgi:hypothetical protein